MDKLKDYILEKLPFLNVGFVEIFLENLTGKLISLKGEDVGIDDRNGKYFYIRDNGSENFRVRTNEAPKTLTGSQNFKLILYAERLDHKEVKQCLINILSYYEGLVLNSVNTNIGEIVRTEYPTKKTTELLAIMQKIEFGTLISVDFTMTREIYINNCECTICEEC